MSNLSPDDVGRQAATAVRWTAIGQVYQVVLQFAVLAILARMVGPHAYGLIGTTAILTGVAGVLRDLGVAPTLVQRPNLTDEHIATARIITLGTSLVSAVAVAAGGIALAAFTRQPEVAPICLGLGIVSLVGGLGVVPSAILQRGLRFRPIVGLQAGAATLSFGAAAACAAAGLGAWSLVVQSLVNFGGFAAGMLLFGPKLPPPRYFAGAARDLFGMSAGMTGVGVMNLAAERISQLFVAKAFGAEAVGLFERSYALSRMPVTQISQVVTRVMVPALSAVQGDQTRFPQMYRASLRLTCFLGFPATIGLAAAADSVVRLVLGAGWERAVPLLQAFALLGAAHTFCHTMGWVFTARGHAKQLLAWTVATLVTRFAAGLVGARYSVTTVAWLWVASDFIALVLPGILIVARLSGLRVSDLLRDMGPSFGAALIAGGITLALQASLRLSPALEATLLGAVMVASYVTIHAALKTRVWIEVVEILKKWSRRTAAERRWSSAADDHLGTGL